jgi:hypothetical protein
MSDDARIEFNIDIQLLGVHKFNEAYNKKNIVYEIRSFMVATCGGLEERKLFVTGLPTIDVVNFIEYEDLTRDILIKWIEEYSGDLIKSLKRELTELLFPTKEYLLPPYIIEE